ncbi:hypothetical protein Adu01nite_65010 [Paractinoplanes durhamensis]|uniref:Uncharacterized protein n=1 Tax=Paractinoplanes durhamensis TaxID=113563 RepID=A0ABQ3Z5T2_9ACTN|nr:hypothetical protein Adu01nite_65010 [Actinoplanes durhamensis]
MEYAGAGTTEQWRPPAYKFADGRKDARISRGAGVAFSSEYFRAGHTLGGAARAATVMTLAARSV